MSTSASKPQLSPASGGEQQVTFDAEYLRRLRERDASTVNHFVSCFYLPIRNNIRHKVSPELAEDLVQDVLLAIFERIDDGEPADPAKLPGYIAGIARHIVFRAWDTKRKPKPVDFDLSLVADAQDRADLRLIKRLDERLVHRIVDKMQPRDREVIRRVIFADQDRSVVAREMGVTQENLRLILCRALKRFRIEWDSYL